MHSNRTTLFHSSPLYTDMSCDFFITFIAYRLPQSRFVTSSTCPKPPCPSTRISLKSGSPGTYLQEKQNVTSYKLQVTGD